MKQVLLELWLENRNSVLFCKKAALVFILLFVGVLIAGYPYGIIWIFVAVSLESASVAEVSQIEYLLPRTDAHRKKAAICKSMVIAGVYSMANTIGYLLTISVNKRYQWDMELLFFIIMMTIFVFLLFVDVRMVFPVIRNKRMGMPGQRAASKPFRAGWVLFLDAVIIPFLACYLFLFIMRKLARINLFAFLGGSQWKFSVAASVIILILLCMRIRMIWNMPYCQEYTG